MYKNVNVNGASVPYGLFSHGADPFVAYQGQMKHICTHDFTDIIAPFHQEQSCLTKTIKQEMVSNGSGVVFYEPPTSGTHTGAYHGNIINMERRSIG